MMQKISSLVLKSIVVVAVCVGVTIDVVADTKSLLFFTIQSNIWIGLVCLVGLVLQLVRAPIKKWMYSVKLIFTVSITLTGVVYCGMLAPFLGSEAWLFSRVLTHVVVPLASIADFVVSDYPADYKKWECTLVTIPPFYYLIFAGIGFALDWDFGYGDNYPYYFLNWGSPAGAFGFANESPYIGVFYYILILLAFVVGVGALYIFVARAVKNKHSANIQ